MTCGECMELFRAQVETINAHGGRAGFHWGTYLGKLKMIRNRDGLREHFKTSGRDEVENAQQEASNLVCIEYLVCTEYLSCMFIRVADQSRYGGLKTALDNQFLLCLWNLILNLWGKCMVSLSTKRPKVTSKAILML